jgi:hypothetical protein
MQLPDGEFGPLPRHGIAGRRGRDQIGARAWCRPFLLDASDTDCRSDADAAFAMPEVYEFLEAERIKYAIRLPANQVLQHRIGYLLKRPVGRPSNEVHRSMPIYLSGGKLRRALSARRFHRHQPVAPGRPGRRLLQ